MREKQFISSNFKATLNYNYLYDKYCFWFFCLFFKIYFIDYAITVVPFLPLYSPLPCMPPPTCIPLFSSCPWVIHISSLASTFPILFLTSPYFLPTIYATYSVHLFPPLSPSHSPADNPPCDLHFCGSVPVLVVCLVFVFVFRFGC